MSRAKDGPGGETPKPAAGSRPARAGAAPTPPKPKPEPPERPPTRPTPPPTENGPAVSVDIGVIKGVARSASRIVSQAAAILEEELSAGIGAAKQIEERLIDVAETRSTNPDEVMARFRKDAHEVVDIALDLLNASTRSLSGLAQRISVGDDRSSEPGGGATQAPTIALPGEIPRGGSATVPFSLENDGDSETARFTFQATDLVNAEGEKIAAQHVTFEPSALTIPPHERESVTINVRVPERAAPGTYSGLVLATNLERLRAVLVVTVE